MNTRTVIIAVVFAAIIAFVAANWSKVQAAIKGEPLPGKDPGTGAGSTGTGGTGNTGGGTAGLNYNKALKRGVIAPEVGELQRLINTLLGANEKIGVDNNFGPQTETALQTVLNRRFFFMYAGKSEITLNEFRTMFNIK